MRNCLNHKNNKILLEKCRYHISKVCVCNEIHMKVFTVYIHGNLNDYVSLHVSGVEDECHYKTALTVKAFTNH